MIFKHSSVLSVSSVVNPLSLTEDELMRRTRWLALGLVVASAIAAAPADGDKAYDSLGLLAVQHQGRRKPLDTLARESLKHIHGGSEVVRRDDKGEVIERWSAVASLLDWSVRPSYWDDQDIILAYYLPLKQLLLAGELKDQLALAASRATDPKDREAIEKLASEKSPEPQELALASRLKGLNKEDARELARLAKKLSGEIKWLSPNEIMNASIDLDGKSRPFTEWAMTIDAKDRQIQRANGAARLKSEVARKTEKLPAIEEKSLELLKRLIHYKALKERDGHNIPEFEIDALPRPLNAAYLAFTTEANNKVKAGKELTPLEENALVLLRGNGGYWDIVKEKDRLDPGTNKEADALYLKWLRNAASWIPLRYALDNDINELERAGYPRAKVEALRAAFHDLEASEKSSPGHASAEKASAFVASARDLAKAVSEDYPTEKALGVESHYNHFGPFVKAPGAYGLAMILLILAVGFSGGRNPSLEATASKVLRVLGVLALASGIGLEIYGFYLRVRITGWAPVTNMYETVIWVALIASILGLVLELIYKKAFSALAASGVALLATVLAANVTEALLDPNIKNLNPVLRSNFWLGTHVTTIVSSYAAFALAMGLGLVAIGFYLTATYRRSASLLALAGPMAPGLLLLIPGALGVSASYAATGGLLASDAGYYLICGVAGVGGMLTIAGLFALVGEAANRLPSRTIAAGLVLAATGSVVAASGTVAGSGLAEYMMPAAFVGGFGLIVAILGLFGATCQADVTAARRLRSESSDLIASTIGSRAATSVQTVSVGESRGAVATLTRPTVAEIRARQDASRPPLDERGLAMQATAARIKPIANFLYRSMQVGVLLVALGTFLGGFWADQSWGRFWGWDAKEVWALITLLVYLVPLHGRFAGWVNTFGLVVASQVCFGAVLMAWYGVNFVLGVGLHSYGFSDGGGQGVVLSATVAVLAVVAGAAWRRGLSMPRVAA